MELGADRSREQVLTDPAAHRRPEVWDITDTPSGDPPPGQVRGQRRPGCH